jgi:tripartite-type tricarboxylate transporter receptor subunit TctC
LALLAAAVPPAFAREFPDRPVRMVVPFPAGQPVDLLARALGERLSEVWRQQVVVENRPGAGGAVGSAAVARMPPDGYALLLGSSGPLAISPALIPNAGYDPVKDFVPLNNLAAVAQVLVVPAASPMQDLHALIAAAKARPGSLTYASAGNGSTSHLTMELLKQMAGLDLQHAPYRGSPPAQVDLIAGRVQAMFDAAPSVIPAIRDRRLRALAVSTGRRIAELPDAPTVAEAGVSGFEAMGWMGLVAPAGLDASLRRRIHHDVNSVMQEPAMRERLTSLGLMLTGGSTDEFADFLASEVQKWRRAVEASGARVD